MRRWRETSVKYAIRIPPANDSLEQDIAELLTGGKGSKEGLGVVRRNKTGRSVACGSTWHCKSD